MVPISIWIIFIWHISYRWWDFSRSTRPVWRANSIWGQENRSWGRRRGRRTWGCQVIYIFTKRRDLQLFWRFFFLGTCPERGKFQNLAQRRVRKRGLDPEPKNSSNQKPQRVEVSGWGIPVPAEALQIYIIPKRANCQVK